MPRRNLLVLLTVTLVALLCYPRVQKNRYARVLADAMATIESRYVEPIDGSSLFEGAMDGMMDRLDGNSAFIAAADLPEFDKIVDQEYVGVGIVVALEPRAKQLTVLSLLAGMPAYQAGIRAGDKILRIDETSTRGMSLADAVNLLYGQPGEPVTLTVTHEGEETPVQVTIVREKIQVPTVVGDVRNADGSWDFFLPGRDRIGYVRVRSFTDTTAGELAEALRRLSDGGMRGLVLDLRDDPGGYLDAAVDVCDSLIDSGVIVTTRRRDGRLGKPYTASGTGQYTDFPIAVLVNENTASAAEIVAACLQDHRRAAVVGQRTYGKGTVQEVLRLEEGCGAMKLTVASYWRPSGKNIQRPRDADQQAAWGVSPDEGYKVSLGNDEQSRWRAWRARRDVLQSGAKNGHEKETAEPFVDRPLARAVEYVEKEAAGKQ
jgi:carboxyl-terminal processing protease